MFGGNSIYLLIPPLVSVLAIMLLDQLRHAGRGRQYYVLAYLMVLAFQLVYMFLMEAIGTHTPVKTR